MSVRGRILALQIASIVTLIVAAGLTWAGLWIADHGTRRVAAIVNRADVLSQLDAETGHYLQFVAERLTIGQIKTADLGAVRIRVERLMAQLTSATRAEIGVSAGMAEVDQQLPELEGSRRIIEVFHAIVASVNRMLVDLRANRRDSALEIYMAEVSFRVSNELRPLIVSAVAGERKEISDQLEALGNAKAWIAGLVAAVGIAAFMLLLSLGLALRRAVVEPLDALTSRARILAAGGADEPYVVQTASEFGALAHTLGRLADAIRQERQRFAAAGEKLAGEVETRTEELRTANSRLREIDRRRGQFLADVSHELRTPLTILRGEAGVALRGRDDPVLQRQALERIQEQAAELGNLLEDLINYARTEAEDQPYVLTDTRLDDIIIAAAQESEMLAAPREVSIVVRLDDGGRHVNADFRRLKQGLLIAIDNAIKHSPPGGRVEIGAALVGDQMAIRIADQGPGIAEVDLPHVFERFYRGRGNGEPTADGLGIGLSIAKEIVERHGGQISLTNRAEGGALLEIMLPIDQAEPT